MGKLAITTAILIIIGMGGIASAQTPPPMMEQKAQPPHGSMMGGPSDMGCPMMKKMALMEDRLKKREQSTPKQ